jgi:hypothetical protein
MTPCERLTPKEIQISILVWEGLTNREIGKIVGTSEQVIKNHLDPCPAIFFPFSQLRGTPAFSVVYCLQQGTPEVCSNPMGNAFNPDTYRTRRITR